MSGLSIRNARVLTESGFHAGLSVTVRAGRIDCVGGEREPAGAETFDAGGLTLLPGFVDLQVNGGGGVLFNDAPTVETLGAIGAAHCRFGTTGFLPTLITDEIETIARGMAAVDAAIEAGVPGVLGIHVEGPFLNEKRRGVHDASLMRPPDDAAVELLTSLRHGRTLVTLAPEIVPARYLDRLVDSGVIVAAGHTDAGYPEVRAALDAGLHGFTHLYNAMSPLASRAPGAVGAALEDPNSWCGLIADGFHVHPAALRIAIASKPQGRCLLVTDAMPCVGTSLESFELQGRTIRVAGGRCVTGDGVLAGSALDMAAAVRYAMSALDVDEADAVRMASGYPADAVGLGKELGRVAAGYRADLVLVDEAYGVVATWVGGRQVFGRGADAPVDA